jgi:hypothetical protein
MKVIVNLPTSKVEALIELGLVELKPQLELYSNARHRMLNSLDSMIGIIHFLNNSDEMDSEMLDGIILDTDEIVTDETNEVFWNLEVKALEALEQISQASTYLSKSEDSQKRIIGLKALNSNLSCVIERYNDVFSGNIPLEIGVLD